ncbi:YgdI/YgdR family lipoprotein [Chryseobacterium sp. JUb7]|uniref:YgdI/YgdR family lipoprotein n=1 Tax=Chryseobacterium sp. JUb7 TaxID=2940599 RepID=UPI002169B5B6|nr:YgdI/YgdR family lipoprotein [Chryseobacterium sp. JUb7]MCS3531531.1 hypothetical protein [Chryseobacterium sp. JUb7]
MKKLLFSAIAALLIVSCSVSNDSIEDTHTEKRSLQTEGRTVQTKDGKMITADTFAIDEKTGFVKASGKHVKINLNSAQSSGKHHGCRFIVDVDNYIDWAGPGTASSFCGISIEVGMGDITIYYAGGSVTGTGTIELDGLDACTIQGFEDLVEADPTNALHIICE